MLADHYHQFSQIELLKYLLKEKKIREKKGEKENFIIYISMLFDTSYGSFILAYRLHKKKIIMISTQSF